MVFATKFGRGGVFRVVELVGGGYVSLFHVLFLLTNVF